MAERHDAEREVVQARARLTKIAEELSRRATPEYVKAQARERAMEFRDRAKVVARERTYEMRDRFLDSPWALGAVGGAIGAAAGKLLGDRARSRYVRHEARFDLPYDEYTATHPVSAYETERIITEDPMYGLNVDTTSTTRMDDLREAGEDKPGLKERAQGAVSSVKEKASGVAHELKERTHDLKGRASERTHDLRGRAADMSHGLRDRMPSRQDVRYRARRVADTTRERPELWGVAAVVAGALFGALMPVTSRERRLLGPVKSDAASRLSAAKEEIVDRASAFKHGLTEELRSDDSSADSSDSRERGNGSYSAEDTRLDAGSGSDLQGGYGASSGFDSGTAGGYSASSDSGSSSSFGSGSSFDASSDSGNIAGTGSSGALGGAGYAPPDSGAENKTYSAGGESSSTEQPGYHDVPDPDVTRH